MNYVFKNNGLPYRFSDEYCGGGQFMMLHYDWDKIISIKLTEEEFLETFHKSRLFGFIKRIVNKLVSKQYIVIHYNKYSFTSDKEIEEQKIALEKSEYSQAKEVVKYVNDRLRQNTLKKKLEEEQERKKFEETVKVIDREGKEHHLRSYCSKLSDEKLCLIVEDGETYHTWLDCYKNWDRRICGEFDCWYIKTKKDVKKQGFRECSFCKERNYDSEHFDEILDDLCKQDEELYREYINK